MAHAAAIGPSEALMVPAIRCFTDVHQALIRL